MYKNKSFIYKDVKFIKTMDNNDLKKKSLEDTVYFTLRDILFNVEEPALILEATIFMDTLTKGICLENRKENFRYSKILENKTFVFELYVWLFSLLKSNFIFETNYHAVALDGFMLFDKWIDQLNELIEEIDELYYDL
jgi:hypothetical protein